MAVNPFRRSPLVSRGLSGRWLCSRRDDLFAQGDNAPSGYKLRAGLPLLDGDGASMSISRATRMGMGVNQLGVEHARQVFFHDALQAGQGF